mmetsp:Transcript_12899/g.20271  ORF Transcript_12899/g.20271 Transcript_12899/m.20271 type:complete len:328 (+) Transcript_12899:269-1252(+)|eukprot:CAMPEP_0184294106 /NCGR_PEP_ID=MMETSP1049-20130417/5371_1 /TAXON_ID=77928 /ORGANISM="Proteomonas sulcata, Strain CCMP704" /LENGTH=327 /DNA_ID=CAMNT_0026602273 /DNA_START=152 /DNA_END=1135 /DNA_ORIENTATION=-
MQLAMPNDVLAPPQNMPINDANCGCKEASARGWSSKVMAQKGNVTGSGTQNEDMEMEPKVKSLSPTNSSAYSDPESSQRTGSGPADKKAKHKLVEQNRRETTKALLSDLQDMLPNMAEAAPGCGINVVLEGALDYIRNCSVIVPGEQKPSNADPNAVAVTDERVKNELVGRACAQMKSSLRYLSAYDSAPFGIVIARVDGTILRSNAMFDNFLLLPRNGAAGSTMFSLTAPQDLPGTLQGVSALLTGSETQVSLNKHCVDKAGNHVATNVQIHCLWKEGRPSNFVCYVRDRSAEQSHRFEHCPSTTSSGACSPRSPLDSFGVESPMV